MPLFFATQTFVSELKEAIQQRYKMPTHRQLLTYCQKPMEDTRLLSDYRKFERYHLIFITFCRNGRLRGSGIILLEPCCPSILSSVPGFS